LKIQIQIPFNAITANIHNPNQIINKTMVKIIYFLQIFYPLGFVCFFQMIVGNATIQNMMMAARISLLVPLPNTPKE